jgi:hypothetical protein
LGLAGALLVSYNLSQSGLVALRNNEKTIPGTAKREAYGPSLQWLDRLARASEDQSRVKLDFSVMSSLMVAGCVGFQIAGRQLLWMKSDEYWHQAFYRQVPLMEAVVTLDPQFIDAWSTRDGTGPTTSTPNSHNKDYQKKGPKVIRARRKTPPRPAKTTQRGANLIPTNTFVVRVGLDAGRENGHIRRETLEKYRIARQTIDARELR